MEINRNDLLSALEKVKPGLAKTETIEQSTSFAFLKDRIVTYNDEISISCPVVGLDIEGVILAEELYEFLNKVKQEVIDVKVEDNEVKIKAGAAKAGLTLQSSVRLPLGEIGNIKDWNPIPGKFIEGLKFVIPACSKDMHRPVLLCTNIREDGIMESSDSYRIAEFNLEEEMPIGTFLIPADTALKVSRFDPKEIASGSGWAHFKAKNDAVLSCRVFEDKFPNTSVIKIETDHRITIPKDIREIVERAYVFAKRDTFREEEISVSITKNKMTIRSESEIKSHFEEDSNIEYEGEDFEFLVSPKLLGDVLTRTDFAMVGERAIKFEGKDWKYLTLLKAIKNK